MEKKYILKGLTCANCANKIENSVKTLNGIADANVNLITTTLKLELSGEYIGNLSDDVEKIVHKYEPDIVVSEEHIERSVFKEDNKKEIIQLGIGAVLIVVGLLLNENRTVQIVLFIMSYVILGREVILKAVKNITKGQIFDENFLMSIATIGAFAIGDYAEAASVMLFYQIGEFFQEAAVKRSKRSISDLMDIRPDYANIKINDEIKKVSPDLVKIGDIIIVKPGEKIPLDGVVVEGESLIDTKALTGEPAFRRAKINDSVLSGCINQNGVLTIKVTKIFKESTVAKIIDLVESSANKKSSAENFITTFSRFYTPIVVISAVLLAIIPPLILGASFLEWVNRALVFLVISCPCALVISIPLGFFGGIGGASKKGILIKGGNYLEALNKLEVIVFDKTGTLTKGVFKVKNIKPSNGFTADGLIKLAAQAEYYSNHPIALSIREFYGKDIDKNVLKEYKEISGYGMSVRINDDDVLIGNEKLMELNKISFIKSDDIGTKIYCAMNGMFVGSLTISDEIKEDSKKTIAGLKAMGVSKVVMLTGDNLENASAIGEELFLDEVYGQLLPIDKVEKLDDLLEKKSPKSKLAFVGDGINDAPVLKRADIGIAMGGLGSDAAIEAADIVLMTDEPSKIIDAINVAQFTKKIVWQNIIFALSIKGIFLVLGTFGIATMWEAVFADVGVALIAILNATRVLKK